MGRSRKRHRAHTGGCADLEQFFPEQWSSQPGEPSPTSRRSRRFPSIRDGGSGGSTRGGDSCYVPVAVEVVPCSALVDNGSSGTVLRTDVCPEWIQLKSTDVQLRTTTGGLAQMKGTGLLTVTLRGKDRDRQQCVQ